jgi:hypothetical protein
MLRTSEQREQARVDMLARKEKKRVNARRGSARRAMRKRRFKAKEVRRVQRFRKKKKAEAKAARHIVLMAEKAARDARRVARQQKKALDLRKRGTAQAGFTAGWLAVAPQTDEELKALSWAKRYREAYAHGASEKRRCQELMEVQEKALPQPNTITL